MWENNVNNNWWMMEHNPCTIYCMWSLDLKRSIICTLQDKKDNLWTRKHEIKNAYTVILPNDHNPDKIINNEANNNSTEIVFSVFIMCHVFNLDYYYYYLAKMNVIFFFLTGNMLEVFFKYHIILFASYLVCKWFEELILDEQRLCWYKMPWIDQRPLCCYS